MQKIIIDIFFSLGYIVLSCNRGLIDETKLFNNYLLKEFNITIPDTAQTFIIISDVACQGCLSKGIIQIDRMKFESKPTLIASNLSKLPASFSESFNILIDPESDFDYCGLQFYNICIVVTAEKRLSGIIQLDEFIYFAWVSAPKTGGQKFS